MKRCSKCLEIKELKEFAKRKASKDGLAYQCRKCNTESAVKSNRENPEKHSGYVKRWQKNNWERHLKNCQK